MILSRVAIRRGGFILLIAPRNNEYKGCNHDHPKGMESQSFHTKVKGFATGVDEQIEIKVLTFKTNII